MLNINEISFEAGSLICFVVACHILIVMSPQQLSPAPVFTLQAFGIRTEVYREQEMCFWGGELAGIMWIFFTTSYGKRYPGRLFWRVRYNTNAKLASTNKQQLSSPQQFLWVVLAKLSRLK